MSPERENRLLDAVAQEMDGAGDFYIPLSLNLSAAMSLVGSLQLSLRHPENVGPSANVAREVIEGIIAIVASQGFAAVALLMRMGDNPRFDGGRG